MAPMSYQRWLAAHRAVLAAWGWLVCHAAAGDPLTAAADRRLRLVARKLAAARAERSDR